MTDTTPEPEAPLSKQRQAFSGIGVNWYGIFSLSWRETKRFLNVWAQTVAAPVISSMIFLAIFTLALGRALLEIDGLPFTVFIIPGVVMMAIVQNSFANASSSLMIARMQGNVTDLLLSPLSALEIVIALSLGAVIRGLVVGTLTLSVASFFVDIAIDNIAQAGLFALLGAVLLGSMGVLGGIWAEKMDQMAMISNFVIMPLSFLSGTFYPIARLPEPFYTLTLVNPFYYLIDGFRNGITGRVEGNTVFGALFLVILSALVMLLSWHLIRRGALYKN